MPKGGAYKQDEQQPRQSRFQEAATTRFEDFQTDN